MLKVLAAVSKKLDITRTSSSFIPGLIAGGTHQPSQN